MKTLILIDGHALAYRQYYALERTAMSTTDNQPTWAVYGFFKAIFDLLKSKKIKSDAIAVAFDVHRQNFRMEKYEEYKANRVSMPDNMRSQMGLIQEGLKAFSIPIYTKDGFEADDVIGTITKQASALGHKTYILTGDQDSFQLIDKEGLVTVLLPNKGELTEYNWDKVYEKLGVYPNQIVDYKALRGDTSDNIPGIKGIGDKTAQALLGEYQNLENILNNAENIKQNSLREKLINGKEIAKLSQYLATIVRDVDVNFDFDKACVELPDIAEVTRFLQSMQFHTFIKNINNILASFNANCDTSVKPQKDDLQLGLFSQTIKTEINNQKNLFEEKVVEDVKQLVKTLQTKNLIAINIDTLDADENIITEINFGIKEEEKYKIYSVKSVSKEQLNLLKEIIENEKIKKYVQNAKHLYSVLKQQEITINGIEFDTMLASYVKDSSRQHELKSQAFEHLQYITDENFKASEKAYLILKLTEYWEKELEEKELKLVKEVELPLSFILADMEMYGVSVDVDYLKTLTDEYSEKLKSFEKKIFEISGCEFNVNSPKQVADILYNNLGIQQIKKSKNKFSTNAEILEELSGEYPVCAYLLEYRKYAKLKSTYTEALPELISKKDNKIHTSYNQTTTTTGRLSSSNPNLQNIPTRSEDSQKIRKAFVPSDKNKQVLLSADYSQIELRLLAHCANEEKLIDAFNKDEDIHSLTASKVFDVPVSEVTKDMRRKAKAVNFGIIYGQSRYGLSKALGIPPFVAQEFIDKYFETYPKVKEYMQTNIEFAHKYGYTETIFGRKRYFGANLTSSNKHIQEAAERAAINHPLQGSAADLIKMAMNSLFGRLTESKLKSKIILQVHDELIVEVFNDELDIVKTIVKESMELNQPLNVPLVVDIAFGKNWVEL